MVVDLEGDGTKSQIVQVKIDALAFGGAGIGTVSKGSEQQVGKKAFVPYVVPGELVEGVVIDEKPRYLQVRLINVLEDSPNRRHPPCPVFGECGGCALQHIDGESQRQEKLNLLRQMVLKQAGVEPLHPIELLGAQLPFYHYRRRISLHLDEGGRIGFFKVGSGDLVCIQECLLASPPINQTLKILLAQPRCELVVVAGIVLEEHCQNVFAVIELKDKIAQRQAVINRLIELLRNQLCNFQIRSRKEILYCQESFKRRALPSLPVGHFSQVNAEGNALLVGTVIENMRNDKVTDLYAGAGNFSIPLAKNGKNVVAVEIDQKLVDYGRVLAESESVSDRLSFVRASTESFLKSNRLTETVLLDPPRSGAVKVVSALNPSDTKELFYVSCNLPTLVRDLKVLHQKDFVLEKLIMIDMFPQTSYMETVAVFRLD